MDSLRILHDSLDSSRAPTAGASKRNEKKLNQEFKAAALHLTNLYRGSLTSSAASYRSGYLGGLRDILDLVLLRGTQDSDRPDRLEAFLACDDSLQDGGGGAGPSRGPSQQELRWLARYLKARIEAIKSESDEEEAETTDNEATSSSQQQAESGSAARRSGGRSAQDVVDRRQRTASEVSEEQAYRSPAPTEPNTPAHPRYQGGQTNTSSSSGIELAASGSAAPSSSFSFAMASPGMSSPNFAVSTATGTTSASRRRTRGLPSSHSHQSSSPASGRGRQNTNSTPLSPVGEEAMLPGTGGFDYDDDDDDGMEDIREERGNGRRGPLMMHRGDAMGERPKRRRKTAAVEKIGPVTHASIGREDRRRGGGGGEDDSAAR